MKRYSLLIPILAFALSCTKDSSNGPVTTTIHTCLLTEQKDSATGKEKITYEYDDAFRLVKVISSVPDVIGEHEEYVTFQYTSNSRTTQRFRSNGPPYPAVTYALNSDGTMAGAIVARPDTVFGQAGFLRDTTIYTYSPDKKLLQIMHGATVLKTGTNEILSRGHLYITYTYTEGRLSKTVNDQALSNTTGAGGNIYTSYYFYDETTPTVTFNPAVGYNIPLIAGGALMSDKIPVKITSDINGGEIWNTEYTATVNPQGFPTKIRSVEMGPSGPPYYTHTMLYTYTCY